MSRKAEIQNAYQYLGKEATFYDGMITCSTIPGKAVCKVVWNMGTEENSRYLELAMAGIPEDFSGKMLEVPVGTGVLTMPVYKTLPNADITCLDYSADMMAVASVVQGKWVSITFSSGRAMSAHYLLRISILICCCPLTVSTPFPIRKRPIGRFTGF